MCSYLLVIYHHQAKREFYFRAHFNLIHIKFGHFYFIFCLIHYLMSLKGRRGTQEVMVGPSIMKRGSGVEKRDQLSFRLRML